MTHNTFDNGFHAVPPGVIAWIDVIDGDTRETIIRPYSDDVHDMCDTYDVDYQEFIELLNKAREQNCYGIVLDVQKWKASRNFEAGLLTEAETRFDIVAKPSTRRVTLKRQTGRLMPQESTLTKWEASQLGHMLVEAAEKL